MTENRCFEKVDFSSLTGEEEFYDCRFVSCDFSEVLFREPLFERCEFQACNFSMTKFRNTLREIRFTDCKLMGTDFSGLKPFSSDLSFVRSRMDYANFSGVRLRKAVFPEAGLSGLLAHLDIKIV